MYKSQVLSLRQDVWMRIFLKKNIRLIKDGCLNVLEIPARGRNDVLD